MKKSQVVVLFVLMALVALPLVQAQQPATAPAAPAAGQQPAAAQQPANPAPQQQKKEIKDPAEYNAYMAATGAQDPNQRISQLESFLTTYPNSVMKADAMELLLKSYQQAGNAAKMLETGQKLLQMDPNNLTALAFVSYLELTQAQQGGPDGAQKITDAGQLAVRGLKVLQTAPKPEGVSDEQWAKTKDTFRYTIFDWSAAMAAVQAKDYPTAVNYLKDRVSNMPNDLGTVYYLGQSYLEQRPPVVDGLFWIARAVALAPNNTEIAKYGRSRYIRYHGTDQGWEQLIADAKNQTTIPQGFSVAPAPSPADQAHEMLTQKAPEKMAFAEWQFILENGSPADVTAVWTAAKGKPIQAIAQVISATPKVLMLAATEDDIQSKTADIELTLATPITAARAAKLAGTQITFQGVPTEYTSDAKANPPVFLMKMNEGQLIGKSAEEPKTAPKKPTAHRTPSH
jgi:tetratricopeptide (TPR) repeat protein